MRKKIVLAVIALSITQANLAQAIQIPVGVDLSGLSPVAMEFVGGYLKLWRGGTDKVYNLTFQYFTGTNLAYPNRSVVKDDTANNQNYLWSDEVVEFVYKPANIVNSAILMYTDNKAVSPQDPLASVALRGGLVGGSQCDPTTLSDASCGNRASILPLIWKSVTLTDMTSAIHANVTVPGSLGDTSSNPSPFHMPTYIATYGQGVDAGDVYAGGGRANTKDSGFNDYSTHFVLDKNNTDKNNLWWSNYTDGPSGQSGKAFRYASLVGAWGMNWNEAGYGGPQGWPWQNSGGTPGYYVGEILLGMGTANALVTTYSTTIYVEQISY